MNALEELARIAQGQQQTERIVQMLPPELWRMCVGYLSIEYADEVHKVALIFSVSVENLCRVGGHWLGWFENSAVLEGVHFYGGTWRRVNGKLGSPMNALPALESGSHKEWQRGGIIHRDGDPAVIYHNGQYLVHEWYQDGLKHRDGGPAVIKWSDGRLREEQWWHLGQRHREDGPAVIWHYATQHWLRGEHVTERIHRPPL